MFPSLHVRVATGGLPALLAGGRGRGPGSGPAPAGGRGPLALGGGAAVVEVGRRHALCAGLVAHTLQLVTPALALA